MIPTPERVSRGLRHWLVWLAVPEGDKRLLRLVMVAFEEKRIREGLAPLYSDGLISTLPPEARCQRPAPHAPHRHEITWSDLVGGYWCDGAL